MESRLNETIMECDHHEREERERRRERERERESRIEQFLR